MTNTYLSGSWVNDFYKGSEIKHSFQDDTHNYKYKMFYSPKDPDPCLIFCKSVYYI